MLPVGELAREVHVACVRPAWEQIEERLKRAAPNEACTFALVWPSRGKERASAIVGDVIWPRPGEVQATPHSLEISADYISRALDLAIDTGELCGVALVHTHPETTVGPGIGTFSSRDDWYEQRLFPTLTRHRPRALCASLVIGSMRRDVDARVWWQALGQAVVQPAQAVRIVGPELSLIETPRSTWIDHLDPQVMNRSTRLWGEQGRRRLQNLRIGVVGAGGTGSVVLLALATMGAGRLTAWDKDTVKKENLHRMLGVARSQCGQSKVKALGELLRKIATANPFVFREIEDWGTSIEALKELKDCDVIFSCVDNLSARVKLNDHAYANLIPTIDIASWIHANDGEVDSISTHAHVWSPGIPCAWCRQTLSPFGLMREAQGTQRGVEDRAAYGLLLEETDGIEPSVLPLNMTGVSLALMEFMQVALGVTSRTPRDLKFFLPQWELDESDLDTAADCSVEMTAGRGDFV